jgi:hypothetical protein
MFQAWESYAVRRIYDEPRLKVAIQYDEWKK